MSSTSPMPWDSYVPPKTTINSPKVKTGDEKRMVKEQRVALAARHEKIMKELRIQTRFVELILLNF